LRARAGPPSMARWPRTFHAALLLATLASLLYANSLGNNFVFDDTMLITQAREFSRLAEFHKIFDWDVRRTATPPADYGVAHRPVRTAALAIQWYVFGSNPFGYRVVSILLHILNGSLVFVILRALLGRPWPALFAATLFVVHPIQTESVAYVAGQRDLLFTVLYLLGFLSFVRYRSTGRSTFLILAGLAYLLDLLTKEMAITLPLLCVAYDLLRSMPGTGPDINAPVGKALREGIRVAFERSRWLYIVIGAVLALLLLYFVVIANPSHQRMLYGGGVGPTLLTSARIFVFYLKQMVFPLTLNADSFGAFSVSRSLMDLRGVLALLVLGGSWYGLFLLLRIDRWISFGGVWFFLTLLPVSQIVPHQELVAEHFLYLPSVGFCLLVALFVERGLAVRRAATAVAGLFVLTLFLLGARTVLRNRDWKDELTLWTKAVQAAPDSYWAHQRLGDAYKAQGRYEEAIREYKTVQALAPGYATEYIAIADSYRRLGRYGEAVDQFSMALEVSPSSVAARLGLSQTYLAMGLVERAREEHRQIARFVSKTAEDFRATGDAKMAQGHASDAAQAYRNGLEFNPFDPMLHIGLWKAYTALGRYEEAAAAYRRARELDPTVAPANGGLDKLTTAVTPVGVPGR